MKAIAFPLLCHHSNIGMNDCANEMLKATNICQPLCSLDEERYLSTACATTAPLGGHSITCQQFLAPEEHAFTEECMDFDDNEEDLKSASDVEYNLLVDYICQQTEMEGDDCDAVINGAILKCKQECSKNEEECTLKPFEDGGPNVTCSDLLQDMYERNRLVNLQRLKHSTSYRM